MNEVDEYVQLTDRLGQLLTGVAAALKGEPDELTLHDWSDLPQLASRVMADLEEARAALVSMATIQATDVAELLQLRAWRDAVEQLCAEADERATEHLRARVDVDDLAEVFDIDPTSPAGELASLRRTMALVQAVVTQGAEAEWDPTYRAGYEKALSRIVASVSPTAQQSRLSAALGKRSALHEAFERGVDPANNVKNWLALKEEVDAEVSRAAFDAGWHAGEDQEDQGSDLAAGMVEVGKGPEERATETAEHHAQLRRLAGLDTGATRTIARKLDDMIDEAMATEHVIYIEGPLRYPGGKDGFYEARCSAGDYASSPGTEAEVRKSGADHVAAKIRTEVGS